MTVRTRILESHRSADQFRMIPVVLALRNRAFHCLCGSLFHSNRSMSAFNNYCTSPLASIHNVLSQILLLYNPPKGPIKSQSQRYASEAIHILDDDSLLCTPAARSCALDPHSDASFESAEIHHGRQRGISSPGIPGYVFDRE